MVIFFIRKVKKIPTHGSINNGNIGQHELIPITPPIYLSYTGGLGLIERLMEKNLISPNNLNQVLNS